MSPVARPLALVLSLAGLLLAAFLPAAVATPSGQAAPAAAVAKKSGKKAKDAKKAKRKAAKVKAKAKARRKAKAKRKAIDPRLGKAWAKRYRVRKGDADPDHDGLNNLGEYRADLHPKRADTDGDGIPDGDENPGTITAISPAGATIALFGGGTLTAAFTADTYFTCAGSELDDAIDETTEAAGEALEDVATEASHARASDDDGDDPAEDEGDDAADDSADDDATDLTDGADDPTGFTSPPAQGCPPATGSTRPPPTGRPSTPSTCWASRPG